MGASGAEVRERRVDTEYLHPSGVVITPEFTAALGLLHAGHNVFLTGKAGTGKSTLIRFFQNETRRRIMTVAPTGIAALNVDGYTIHRLFSFSPSITPDDVRFGSYRPGRFAKAITGIDTLIVDEASMVRADLFDSMAAALERFGPHPGQPFGGVQLVLVGDLYQLPPVVTDAESRYFETTYASPFFFSADSYSPEQFPTIELTRVFRQIGDDRLVDLLNAVREGALLDHARAELNQRTDRYFEPPTDEYWLTLATTNRIVTSRNREQLERLPDPLFQFRATVHGETDGFEYPTDTVLQLKVGAQIMLLNNDPADRWVNGSIGRIEWIDVDGTHPEIGVRLREGGLVTVAPHLWEITRPAVRGGRLEHDVIGTFTQLPMKLAWAITIHKSQGQTLENVVVDLTGGTFANGQLYVALSRCTSLDGLVLRRDVLPRDLKTDIRVRRFLASQSDPSGSLGTVSIAILTVGTEGDKYRPRPVEIAVVTDDGDEAVTIVNPTCDLYGAEREFGITTRDVQLAPVLTEAWAALSPLLAGRITVGVDVDRTLGLIDFELKRNASVEAMPLGAEIGCGSLTAAERAQLQSPNALDRARAMQSAARRLGLADVAAAHAQGGAAFPTHPRGRGYLQARRDVPAEERFVVGGNLHADDDAAQVLAECLTTAWERVIDRDEAVVAELNGLARHIGVEILPEGFELPPEADGTDFLTAGARVCFTGDVLDPVHGWLSREQMWAIAMRRGLVISMNMTKTRTDVLVVAQRGTQSGKAKKAYEWGKPVVSASEFLDWALG